MNRKLLRFLELVLAAVLVVSLVMVVHTQMEYAQGASIYDEAAAVAKLPQLSAIPISVARGDGVVSDPNLLLLADLDLDELWQKNPDVIGWVSIPETELSYPLLQGEDNDFYLKHTWRKGSSSLGSVFMEYRCSADLTDFNTIIYGHRTNNRSMFGSLKDFRNQDHWSTHPSIYLAWAEGVYRYDIFAAYEASVTGPVYDFEKRDLEGREEFIASSLELSLIDTGIVPTVDDHILTLSTCTGKGYQNRWVVQGVLTETYVRNKPSSGRDAAGNM